MTRRAAIIVEVNAVLDRCFYEAKHLAALVANGVAVIADLFRDAEVDSEARSQPLHAGVYAVARKKRLQAVVESVGHGTDMIVEWRLPVGGDGGQSGGHCHGM